MAQRVFCTQEVLSEVIRLRKDSPYSSVYSVIERLSDLVLECEDKNTILKLAASNPFINKLLKRPNRSIIPQKNIIDSINNALADDIFLLLPPRSKSFVGYREKRGVLVTTSLTDMQVIDDLVYKHHRPYTLLTRNQKKRFNEHDVEYEDITSWTQVFDGIQVKPINAAVIIDNYLFHKFDRREQSLYPIIKALMPGSLSIPFHLTIFVLNKNGELKKENMEKVIDEIHKLNTKTRILVSIIAHTQDSTTHDRKILTNYHLITSGKGFSVIDKNGVCETTYGNVSSTLHNICNLMSATSLKSLHSQTIDWMKDIYIDRVGMVAVYAFEVGDKFDNRLLTDK